MCHIIEAKIKVTFCFVYYLSLDSSVIFNVFINNNMYSVYDKIYMLIFTTYMLKERASDFGLYKISLKSHFTLHFLWNKLCLVTVKQNSWSFTE